MNRFQKRWVPSIAMLAAAVVLPGYAYAGMATGEQIKAAVSDKSLQGSMLKDMFAEYYASDGSIRGKNYTGKWRVSEDAMCFQYGEKPENCWQIELNGPALTLYKDGKVDGNGMLVDGNPGGF